MSCGRGAGGLVVSVQAFYSNDPSLISNEDYNFSVKLLLKRTTKTIRGRGWPILKKE